MHNLWLNTVIVTRIDMALVKVWKYRQKKLAHNEYQYVADAVVEFYSCATCVKGI